MVYKGEGKIIMSKINNTMSEVKWFDDADQGAKTLNNKDQSTLVKVTFHLGSNSKGINSPSSSPINQVCKIGNKNPQDPFQSSQHSYKWQLKEPQTTTK